MKKSKEQLRKIRDDLNNMTNIKTHPRILKNRIFSLEFLNLLKSTFNNSYIDNSVNAFSEITFYLKRIERLSQKETVLCIIEYELFRLRWNEKFSEDEFKKRVQEIISFLREALKK